MKKLLTISFFLISGIGFSQEAFLAKNAFMGRATQQSIDFWNIAYPGTGFHSSMKPYLSGSFMEAADSLLPFKSFYFNNSYLSRSFTMRNDSSQNTVELLPIIDLEPGYDLLKKQTLFSFTGGAHVKVNLGRRFTFAASLFGGQAAFPFYLDTTVVGQKIIPEFGQGYSAGTQAYAFFDYRGYLSYTTKNKVFNIQAGRGKHFVGDGYRSVLLSDYAPASPYLKFTANFWKLQYSVWYAWMLDVSNANGFKRNYTNKYGAFHYLNYNVAKVFSVGLFENVIWRGSDTSQTRTFDVNYLNPLIFYRPQEYSVGSPDNSFIGINMNATILKRVKVYGQLGLDEFYLQEIKAGNGWWANKQAWQVGAKYIHAFGIKGLMLQLEYNEARPYTYTHGLPQQNYAHYGMPLAHPFGANFKEIQGFCTYHQQNWELSLQVMYVNVGKDSTGGTTNVGQNIFLSYNSRDKEYGNYTSQGVKTSIIQSHVKFSYLVLPKVNLRFEIGYVQRSENNPIGYALENPYVYTAIRTGFWNSYRDF